ncbi:hypothetical protein B296_00025812, partial [Ensete ventricosum]
FGYAGMFVISVASIKGGMNHFVLVVPVLDQNLYYMGANLTSAGFASALYNMIPAITFIMAIIIRYAAQSRKLIKSRHSQAKIVGSLVTVVGALLMILYKGPVVEFVSYEGNEPRAIVSLQSNTLETYSAELSLTTLICLTGAAMSAVVTLAVEGFRAKPWTIGWDMRLVTAIYSGVVCSGVAYYVQGMVMKERGPVFVTAFNPLCMIITAVLGSIILAEEITLGRDPDAFLLETCSVIGAVIIVVGLYSLIWGKSKDQAKQSSERTAPEGTLQLPIAASDVGKFGSNGQVTLIEINAPKNP